MGGGVFSAKTHFGKGSLGTTPGLLPGRGLNVNSGKPSRCDTRRRRGGPCLAAGNDGVLSRRREADVEEVWQKIRLLQRQQDVAVTEEDYGQAAVLRDTLKITIGELSLMQQCAIRQVELLKSSNPAVKRQAIRSIGECGCDFAIPSLAALLYEEEFRTDAQEAMVECFSKSSNPESNDLMRKGESFLLGRDRDLEAALGAFSELIRQDPSFVEGYNKRATVLYLMDKYEESVQDCKIVVQMQPYHFAAYSGMGLCLFCLRRCDEAIEAFDEALRINPGLDRIRQISNQLKQDTQMGEEI
ncbi:hypothetical protein BSKO_00964 [Bryopsis sp. KO-2023]|nr:hypothetical protein BSKO_00964 [Bryopsis sp. KO-2023]